MFTDQCPGGGQSVAIGIGEPVVGRPSEPELSTQEADGQGQGPEDVVAVAYEGHDAPSQVAELIGEGQDVGQGLHWVAGVGEEVDHWHQVQGGHSLQDGVIEHPRGHTGVVAGQGVGDVLDRLPGVQTEFLGPYVDRVATQSEDGHLHRIAGPIRWLLEDQSNTPTGQYSRWVIVGGQL